MEFKRHFEIKRIEDRDVDVAGEEETKKIRIVTFEKNDTKITLKGERDKIGAFRIGDTVEVRIKNPQTELFKKVGETEWEHE